MMDAQKSIQWSEFNQRFLVQEFKRLKQQFEIESRSEGTPINDAELSANQSEQYTSSIEYLVEVFKLSSFERDVLLLCAGVEMDLELAELCTSYHDDSSKHWPTLEMAFNILAHEHWSAITPEALLRHHQLIYVDESNRLLSARLRIDERVLHFLAGINYLEPRLRGFLKWFQVPDLMAPSHAAIVESVRPFLQQNTDAAQIILLAGNDSSGKKDIAAMAAQHCAMHVYGLKVGDLPESSSEMEAFATLWAREMLLLRAALYIDCEHDSQAATLLPFIERIGGICFVAAVDGVPELYHKQRFFVARPDVREQRFLWQTSLGEAAKSINGILDAVASQFLFSAVQINASSERLTHELQTSEDAEQCFWAHCREIERTRLGSLGQFIETKAGWDDLVLPEQEKTALQQIVIHIRQKLRVYHDWGFAEKSQRGLGISALFTGESGTGKTMAAEVLANELNLDLYRVDLSTVVSKYIGETEKNLSRIFAAAEHNGVILLFDEADALFGKRSKVKDSHDRYANLEVSYLLQRMEVYQGLAILTSNLKSSIDIAFLRRIRFIVQFPFPDQVLREQIWQKVFPSCTPTEELNYRKLARLNMTGGNIYNIALNAAFQAADAEEPVKMMHLAHAAQREAVKRQQRLSEVETRGWIE